MPPRQEIPFEPPLALVLAEHFHDPAVRRQVIGVSDPDKLETAVTKLRAYAKTALQNGETTTPLSAAERFSVVQNSTDPTVEALDQIAMRLDELETLLRGEGQTPPTTLRPEHLPTGDG